MKKVKDRKFVLLCFLQLWAITALIRYCIVLGDQSVLFQDVEEFSPTNATCIESDRRRTGTRRNRRTTYTNTYRYTVNEETYTVTYYGEERRGKDRILYYNPTNPDIVSKYSSYADAAASNAIWIMFAVVAQCVVIFFAVKSMRGNKNYSTEPAGVVIEDDFRFDMNHMNDTTMGGVSFAQEEASQEIETIAFSRRKDEQEVESIPFSRSGEKHEVDEIETIPFTQSNNKPAEEFTLYTEEEYKQMQKGEK